MTAGALFYVVGPSGAGKDSVIAWARAASDPDRVAFAHRYITRPPTPDAENHVALGAEEFEARRRRGWFALHWRSHGLSYGIGREIDIWQAAGIAVVVNGSRAHLAEAAARYPGLRPVLITASADIRAARLRARRRETGAALAERLDDRLAIDHPRLATIDNGGELRAAGQALSDLLRQG